MATESDRKAATNDSLGNQVVINLYCASVSYFDHKLNACIYWSSIRINNIANASHFGSFESFFYTLPDQYF